MIKLVSKINQRLIQHKILVQNFSYLSVLQIFNIIVPLVVYPYLTRVLGLETYGLIAFAQALISYFMVIINFGFNISATKFISVNRKSKEDINSVINSIYTIKLMIFLLSFSALLILVNTVPELRKEKLLYLFSFGICINELLLPIWYFQGIEKMKFITYINLFTRSLYLVSIFIFIKHESDYLLVPVFNAITALIGGLISLYIVYFKDKIIFFIPKMKTIRLHLTESWPIFASGAVRLAYMSTNKMLIGSYIDYQTLAYFDLSDKILTSIKTFVNTIGQVIFPKVSRDRNITMVKKVLKYTLLIIVLLIVMLSVFSKAIIFFFTGNIDFSAQLILIFFSFSLIPFTISQFLSLQVLLTNGYTKEYSRIIIRSGILYSLLIGFFLLFSLITPHYIITTIIIVEVFILFQAYYYCRKGKLL